MTEEQKKFYENLEAECQKQGKSAIKQMFIIGAFAIVFMVVLLILSLMIGVNLLPAIAAVAVICCIGEVIEAGLAIYYKSIKLEKIRREKLGLDK